LLNSYQINTDHKAKQGHYLQIKQELENQWFAFFLKIYCLSNILLDWVLFLRQRESFRNPLKECWAHTELNLLPSNLQQFTFAL